MVNQQYAPVVNQVVNQLGVLPLHQASQPPNQVLFLVGNPLDGPLPNRLENQLDSRRGNPQQRLLQSLVGSQVENLQVYPLLLLDSQQANQAVNHRLVLH